MTQIDFPAEFYNFIPGKYVLTCRPFTCFDNATQRNATQHVRGHQLVRQHSFTTGDHNLILENNMTATSTLVGRYNHVNSLNILTPNGVAAIHAADAKAHFISVMPSTKLAGKSFCMTGEHAHLSRAVVEKIIELHGGSVKTAVTKGLSYLLQGSAINKGGSKLAKAQKLGITVIHEADFYQLIA